MIFVVSHGADLRITISSSTQLAVACYSKQLFHFWLRPDEETRWIGETLFFLNQPADSLQNSEISPDPKENESEPRCTAGQ